jgi:hypothetical protein
MLRKTRPSSQSYQVAAVWGAPLGLDGRDDGRVGLGKERVDLGRDRHARHAAEPTEQ